MARTDVTTRHNPDQTRVEAVLESGEVPGFSEYDRPSADVYRFFHTEVDEAYSGQGIAGQIAAGVVAFVRAEGAQIAPRCSFIRAYLRRHEETHDLVAEGCTLEPDPEEEEKSA